MRHATFALLIALATAAGGSRAFATPFEPATVPDQIEIVGHLDVDALRQTQLFATAGGQAALDAALDNAPPAIRPVAHTLWRSVRGISFWRGEEHGAVYVETRDARGVAQLIAKLPAHPIAAIDGFPTYTLDSDGNGHKPGFCAAFGGTLVLSDSMDSLERSVHVLGGKAANLAGSNKLPAAARQGVFVFVALGDGALGSIQKAARSKVLQLGLRNLVVDVSESGGQVTASARAEMKSTEALNKAKAILDGLRSLASLSDEPGARTLIDATTVSASGLTLEVAATLPATELVQVIKQHH